MKALSPAPGYWIAIASAEPKRLGREFETQQTPIAPPLGRLAFKAGVRN